jgi:hypothetical protein
VLSEKRCPYVLVVVSICMKSYTSYVMNLLKGYVIGALIDGPTSLVVDYHFFSIISRMMDI